MIGSHGGGAASAFAVMMRKVKDRVMATAA